MAWILFQMLPLIEDLTRFEIGVTVQHNDQPAEELTLVVHATNEGEAILTAHGQIAALQSNRQRLKSLNFGRAKKGGAS